MSNRPTLSVAVPCPTCEGTRIQCFDDKMTYIGPRPCPDCADGTVQNAVNCGSGCIRWGKVNDCPAYKPGDEKNPPMTDFGCTAWTAREGA